MSRPTRSTPRPGFTLLELLIVIAIIAILVVLSVGVAFKVTGSGKARLTEQTLRVLNTALDEYITAKGAPPEPWVLDPRSNGGVPNTTHAQPVIDGVGGAPSATINSVGLFILQCDQVPAAQATLKQLDAKIFHQYNPTGAETAQWDHQPTLLTAFDGWGNPIRYVHPIFKGFVTAPGAQTSPLELNNGPVQLPNPRVWGIHQVLRDNTNSDAGLNPSSRPYFYSCGPDGKPETTDDNVYLSTIRFQKPQ